MTGDLASHNQQATMATQDFQPSLDAAREAHLQASSASPRPTLLPVSISTSSDLLTPTTVFLKLSAGYGEAPSWQSIR